ncbi:MAG: DUF2278 family protein [Rhodospirillaceae bacterium]|nr:DUF2278 family protein [Rhodospirillaceae bacterium]
MSQRRYQLVKARASDIALDDDGDPHIEIRLEAQGESFRAAVNVRSRVPPHDLLYCKVHPFSHPMLPDLLALPDGVTDLSGERPDLALDYVRGGFVRRDDMDIAPFQRTGPQNDLRDFIEPIVRAAIGNASITFYLFGATWGPEPNKPDAYFGFRPGRGVHDIHMNQGSRGGFRDHNGAREDGALLVHLGDTDRWVAVFLAFQSQDWATDPSTGHPLAGSPEPGAEPDRLRPGLSIVAALINPVGGEAGTETVTLLNRTDASVDLGGWFIEDRNGRRQRLAGVVAAGDTVRVVLTGGPDEPRLRNKGGVIRLLTPAGEVATVVAYEKDQAAREGWTTAF